MDEKEAEKTFSSNEKLKANRASDTEEQMKERLSIGRVKNRARRITQKLQEETIQNIHNNNIMHKMRRWNCILATSA